MSTNTSQLRVFLGFRVVLVDPRPILRLDYSYTIHHARIDILSDLEKICSVSDYVKNDLRCKNRVCGAIAAAHLSHSIRSGNRKEIILGPLMPELCDKPFFVMDSAVKMTGRYYSGYYHRSYCDGDEWEPPTFQQESRFTCYRLANYNHFLPTFDSVDTETRNHFPETGFWVTKEQIKQIP